VLGFSAPVVALRGVGEHLDQHGRVQQGVEVLILELWRAQTTVTSG
jgi:hypothetical protein